jgi:hypothetical protein
MLELRALVVAKLIPAKLLQRKIDFVGGNNYDRINLQKRPVDW